MRQAPTAPPAKARCALRIICWSGKELRRLFSLEGATVSDAPRCCHPLLQVHVVQDVDLISWHLTVSVY